MNIFKRLAELEKQNASLALRLAEQAAITEALKATVTALDTTIKDALPELHEQFGEIEQFEKGVNNILLYSAGNKGGDS